MILIYENFPCVVLELWNGYFCRDSETKINEKIYKVVTKNKIEIISQISDDDANYLDENPIEIVDRLYLSGIDRRKYKRIL